MKDYTGCLSQLYNKRTPTLAYLAFTFVFLFNQRDNNFGSDCLCSCALESVCVYTDLGFFLQATNNSKSFFSSSHWWMLRGEVCVRREVLQFICLLFHLPENITSREWGRGKTERRTSSRANSVACYYFTLKTMELGEINQYLQWINEQQENRKWEGNERTWLYRYEHGQRCLVIPRGKDFKTNKRIMNKHKIVMMVLLAIGII